MAKESLVFILLLALAPFASAGKQVYGPYEFDVARYYDGDTLYAYVKIWPDLVQHVGIRINGVNTPEKATSLKCEKTAGLKAAEFTRSFVEGRQCVIVGVEPGKFSRRVLGDIECDGERLSVALIDAGHARPYFGGKREPWCVDPG